MQQERQRITREANTSNESVSREREGERSTVEKENGISTPNESVFRKKKRKKKERESKSIEDDEDDNTLNEHRLT